MKQNIALFFKSLISNNTAIDGARKKPWYAAVIIFFISIIISVVPTTVMQLNSHVDKSFSSTTYLTNQAVEKFAEELQKDEYNERMYVLKQGKESTLVGYEGLNFVTEIDHRTFKFVGVDSNGIAAQKATFDEEKVSYFLFSGSEFYFKVLNPNDSSATAVEAYGQNAYKKVGKDDFRNSYVKGSTSKETNEKTWENWKLLIRHLTNQTRLKNAGVQIGLVSGINSVIVLIMGFMVWILTRGKNNPYRLFTVWNGFATAFWCALSPAILTLGLGFLLKNFSSMLFPLLLGVRVMWLTMKSLRPDGSGYAAN